MLITKVFVSLKTVAVFQIAIKQNKIKKSIKSSFLIDSKISENMKISCSFYMDTKKSCPISNLDKLFTGNALVCPTCLLKEFAWFNLL